MSNIRIIVWEQSTEEKYDPSSALIQLRSNDDYPCASSLLKAPIACYVFRPSSSHDLILAIRPRSDNEKSAGKGGPILFVQCTCGRHPSTLHLPQVL